jgi:hypothetical protein
VSIKLAKSINIIPNNTHFTGNKTIINPSSPATLNHAFIFLYLGTTTFNNQSINEENNMPQATIFSTTERLTRIENQSNINDEGFAQQINQKITAVKKDMEKNFSAEINSNKEIANHQEDGPFAYLKHYFNVQSDIRDQISTTMNQHIDKEMTPDQHIDAQYDCIQTAMTKLHTEGEKLTSEFSHTFRNQMIDMSNKLYLIRATIEHTTALGSHLMNTGTSEAKLISLT